MMINDLHFISVKDCETLRDGYFSGPDLNSPGTDKKPDWQSCKKHCEDTYSTTATFFAWKPDQSCYCKSSHDGIVLSKSGRVSGKLHCCELLQDTAYNGIKSYNLNNASNDLMPDWRSCKAHCEANYASAIFFTWYKNNEWCWCKSGYDTKNGAQVGYTSGKLGCGSTGKF